MRIRDRLFGAARPGEVYAYRTRKPSGRSWLRQWGYVGKSRNGARRHRQHMGVKATGDRFPAPGQPWNDLDPVRYVLWRSGKVRGWRLSLVEALCIRFTMPVYNDKLNRGNPRRIPIRTAKRQRAARDAGRFVVPAANGALKLKLVSVAGMVLVLVGIVGSFL